MIAETARASTEQLHPRKEYRPDPKRAQKKPTRDAGIGWEEVTVVQAPPAVVVQVHVALPPRTQSKTTLGTCHTTNRRERGSCTTSTLLHRVRLLSGRPPRTPSASMPRLTSRPDMSSERAPGKPPQRTERKHVATQPSPETQEATNKT